MSTLVSIVLIAVIVLGCCLLIYTLERVCLEPPTAAIGATTPGVSAVGEQIIHPADDRYALSQDVSFDPG